MKKRGLLFKIKSFLIGVALWSLTFLVGITGIRVFQKHIEKLQHKKIELIVDETESYEKTEEKDMENGLDQAVEIVKGISSSVYETSKDFVLEDVKPWVKEKYEVAKPWLKEKTENLGNKIEDLRGIGTEPVGEENIKNDENAKKYETSDLSIISYQDKFYICKKQLNEYYPIGTTALQNTCFKATDSLEKANTENQFYQDYCIDFDIPMMLIGNTNAFVTAKEAYAIFHQAYYETPKYLGENDPFFYANCYLNQPADEKEIKQYNINDLYVICLQRPGLTDQFIICQKESLNQYHPIGYTQLAQKYYEVAYISEKENTKNYVSKENVQALKTLYSLEDISMTAEEFYESLEELLKNKNVLPSKELTR